MEIPQRIDSKYRFVLLAARRAQQLIQGAPARIESLAGRKPSKIAVEELSSESVEWDYGPAPVVEVEETEVETGDAAE